MTFNLILLISGIVLMAVALILLFKPWVVAALPAYAGLWLLHLSTYTTFPRWIFIFYGIATLMVMGIKYLSPKGEPDGRITGNLYVSLGALMGCLLGILVEARFMVLGTILGTVLGVLAYSVTPQGRWLKFPKSNFIQYLCAKGLAVIVAVAMMGIAVEGFVFDIK